MTETTGFETPINRLSPEEKAIRIQELKAGIIHDLIPEIRAGADSKRIDSALRIIIGSNVLAQELERQKKEPSLPEPPKN